jgi:hypothetical protein
MIHRLVLQGAAVVRTATNAVLSALKFDGLSGLHVAVPRLSCSCWFCLQAM